MRVKSIIAICIVWACSCVAYGQTPGRLLLSTGWLHFSPRDSSGSAENTGLSTMSRAAQMPVFGTDGELTIPSGNSIGLALTYFLDTHWAGEFALGVAPELNLYGAGKWEEMGKLGTVTQWSPVFLLKYYFFDETSRWRPYAGMGVSRSWFKGAHFDNALYEGSFGDAPALSVSSKNTWNAVFNAGLMYQFHKHWFGGLSVSYMPLYATAKVRVKLEGLEGLASSETTYQTPIRISPITTFLHIGYRF